MVNIRNVRDLSRLADIRTAVVCQQLARTKREESNSRLDDLKMTWGIYLPVVTGLPEKNLLNFIRPVLA
jgi:hypothetical protein